MYEYDEYNPKKKDEYEETEQESIDYSADGMEDEPHVDGESIEMEAEVISGEEYTEEISGEQFSEEEGFSEQESVSEATAEEGAEKAEAFAEETAEAEQEYTGPCVREYHYEEKVKKPRRKQSGNGWKKFIAACLVCSIAGGSAIGVSYSAAQSHFGKETGAKTASTSNTESVSYLTNGLSTVDIVKKVKPSVVSVSTTTTGVTQYMGHFTVPYEAEGAGSGVIFYSDDDKIAIATNNHVIEGANSIYVTLDGDKSVPAKVVGTKSESDLAVLSVSWSDLKKAGVEKVTTATFGDSDDLEVGECVIAIGNAMGMGLSATDGIVSMKEQTINVDGNSLTVLQTSAAINSGNSGGALVNMKGEVIGINSAKLASTEVEGMGYAIPITRVSSIIEELMNETTRTKVADSQKSSIGIAGITVDSNINAAYGIPTGVYVASVTPGSGAEAAGIRKGDVITKFDGKAVSTIQELKEKLQYYAAGEAVSITVQSPGEGGIYTEKELTITLSSAQSSEESQSTDNTQAAPEKGNGTHKAMGYKN